MGGQPEGRNRASGTARHDDWWGHTGFGLTLVVPGLDPVITRGAGVQGRTTARRQRIGLVQGVDLQTQDLFPAETRQSQTHGAES